MTDPVTSPDPRKGAGSAGDARAAVGEVPLPQAPLTSAPVMPRGVRPASPGGGRLTNAVLVVGALVAVGGLAFAGGRLTAPAGAERVAGLGNRLPDGSFVPGQGGFPDRSFQPGQGGVPGGFGADRSLAITGTVKSLDGSTLVITTDAGTDVSIDVSGSTYHAQAPAAVADVSPGTDVSVTVDGFTGLRRPGASPGPDATGGPASIRASDVTIVTP